LFGYVTISKGELRVAEYEAYKSIYCGLCKELGRQFGPISRLNLSYDFAFLALLGLSIKADKKRFVKGRCMLNPLKKRKFIEDESVKYSAFTSVILTYSKLLDDLKDEKGFKLFKSLITIFPFRIMILKAKKDYPEIEKGVIEYTTALRKAEKNHGLSIDAYADYFANTLKMLFEGLSNDEKQRLLLGQMGYHIGRWIYILDAYDDLKEDNKMGRFNPLAVNNFTDKNLIDETLKDSLVLASRAYELLELHYFKGILDNIMYLGMPQKQKQIIFGKDKCNERSL